MNGWTHDGFCRGDLFCDVSRYPPCVVPGWTINAALCAIRGVSLSVCPSAAETPARRLGESRAGNCLACSIHWLNASGDACDCSQVDFRSRTESCGLHAAGLNEAFFESFGNIYLNFTVRSGRGWRIARQPSSSWIFPTSTTAPAACCS